MIAVEVVAMEVTVAVEPEVGLVEGVGDSVAVADTAVAVMVVAMVREAAKASVMAEEGDEAVVVTGCTGGEVATVEVR